MFSEINRILSVGCPSLRHIIRICHVKQPLSESPSMSTTVSADLGSPGITYRGDIQHSVEDPLSALAADSDKQMNARLSVVLSLIPITALLGFLDGKTKTFSYSKNFQTNGNNTPCSR